MKQGIDKQVWLIFSKLVGMISPVEEDDLHECRDRFPGVKRVVDKLEQGNRYSDRRAFIDGLDVERTLEKVIVSGKRVRLRKLIGRVAAVTIPLMIGAGAYVSFHSPESLVDPLTNKMIQSRALLFLSDGSSHDLGNGVTNLYDHGGKHIAVDSFKLDYSVKESEKESNTGNNRLVIARGSEYMVVLSDGTKVWLNAESELDYPVEFTPGCRRVKLTGEAYFEVKRDTSSPFVVEVSGGHRLTVLGTVFNIKSYARERECQMTLVSGKVEVRDSFGGTFVLNPSQQAVISDEGTLVREVDVSYYTSWHEGWFLFNAESISNILIQLQRWYDVDVLVDVSVPLNIRVTGKVKRFEKLGDVLEMLETVTDLQFEASDRLIVIKNNRK